MSRDFWLLLFVSFVVAVSLVWLWRKVMQREDILTMPGREEPASVASQRLHRALLALLACVLFSLVANLVLLALIGGMFLEIRGERRDSAEHQRLVGEMQKREMSNAALILVEQERKLKKLKGD